MENFIFQNPVKLIMGRGMIARLAKEIPSDKRIMITFGGGSVKKNGVYDQVKEALKNHYTVEFWGIEPNPAIETLRKAIALGKEEKVDYLLGLGACRTSRYPHCTSFHCVDASRYRFGNEQWSSDLTS